MSKFEERLQAHLARVTGMPPTAGLEGRVLRRTTAHSLRPSWWKETLTVGALIALGVAVLIGLRAAHEGAATKPKPIPKPPATTSPIPATSYYVIQMFDGKVGWLLTDRGLFRTSDDWTNRVNTGPPGVALRGADGTDFLNQSTAWVATSQPDNPRTVTVFHTVNAGRTWQQSSITDTNSAGLAQLDFIDPLNGWLLLGYGAAAGSEGVGLYQTSDAGMHWTRIEQTLGLGHDAPGSLSFGCGKAGVSFVSLTTGWVSGSCAAGGPFLEITHDGGRTWQSQVLPGTSGVLYQSPSTSLPVFFSARTGYLVFFEGLTGRSVLYTTMDGGQTWGPHALPQPPGDLTPTVYFQSLDNGWIISQDGSLVYQTADGGRHWATYRPTPVLKELGSLGFIDSRRGFAEAASSDNQSVLLQTIDGGRTWRPIDSLTGSR